MLLQLATANDGFANFIVMFVALMIALITGLVFHEFCHAVVATWLGDPSPRWAGRLSLNPLRHLEPAGTLMLLLVGFGWAKPVQVNPSRLRSGPALGMATVAAVGPLSNFVMAALFAIPLRAGLLEGIPTIRGSFNLAAFSPVDYLALVLLYVVLINVVIGVFNLIPLPPLDGSRVASALLPGRLGDWYRRIEPYGIGILFLLFAVSFITQGRINVIGWIISPIQQSVVGFLLR
jgi:Zn-dependent protease